MTSSKNTCFELIREDWKYHGMFFANLDTKKIAKEEFNFQLHPIDIGLTGMIWQDENDEWFARCRLKFPSGSKQLYERKLGKDGSIEIGLGFFRQMPLENDVWYLNKSTTKEEMYEILAKSDMIESINVTKVDGCDIPDNEETE
jgi:hypothetical protein